MFYDAYIIKCSSSPTNHTHKVGCLGHFVREPELHVLED